MADVKLPAAFHVLTGGRKKLPVEGDSVREVLVGLDRECPGVLDRLMDKEGSVKRYVNVYRNDSDIRELAGLETTVANDDVIWIVPAVAGGSGA
ncbi:MULTISPECIES: MoaD/ThiS family protein [unclassified Streptomyces]|uniref:MoaD/ThiS family protein n=1 Tax=unclassified Streptomyces TaxID=2593676 RepID=UPI001BEB7705|nr:MULTISPECIES: MoaD/ThiS family protein [unclassified Streptomyces]MBT2407844.1 MoaD/ThiS family protein [Streptomyces sp. ISL-21]MBT2457362.1 MoaD/ThiS family protein [Streptomyces sp. ISL-86]MBT2608466.1 MoaD/ThiS family protein [Streptomyces sp. ISL-87]